MSGTLRWWIWGALAAGAAAALWFAPPPAPAPVDPAPRRAATAGPVSGSDGRLQAGVPAAAGTGRSGTLLPPALRLPPPPAPPEPDDARRFAAMWTLAPPPAAAAASAPPRNAAPPPPPAPVTVAAAPAALAWPYRLLGRWRDGERDAVILQGPDGQVAIASQGDTLPGDWRIDTMVANALVYSHVPSGQRQTLDLGFAR